MKWIQMKTIKIKSMKPFQIKTKWTKIKQIKSYTFQEIPTVELLLM